MWAQASSYEESELIEGKARASSDAWFFRLFTSPTRSARHVRPYSLIFYARPPTCPTNHKRLISAQP